MNGSRMHDGWEYVAAAYATTTVLFGVWFWMIGAKLRRLSRARASEAGTSTKRAGRDG